MIYLQLFLAFLQIGAFSFGGGYAAMPLIQAQVIDRYGWLSMADFTDLVTIAEMTPGPIAINAATFVGNQMAGIPGALCATLGVILPSCLFVSVLAYLYNRYRNLSVMKGVLGTLRPAVVAMILAAGLSILLSSIFEGGLAGMMTAFRSASASAALASGFQWRHLLLVIAAFFVLRKWKKINPILVMTGCGIVELICYLI